jgi:hypothetical protein
MPDDPELMEQAKAAFGAWLVEAGDAIVDPGAPAHMATRVGSADGVHPVEIGGYSMIQADTPDAAADVLKTHPYVARGGVLLLNEVLDV